MIFGRSCVIFPIFSLNKTLNPLRKPPARAAHVHASPPSELCPRISRPVLAPTDSCGDQKKLLVIFFFISSWYIMTLYGWFTYCMDGLHSGPSGNETWQSKSPLIYTGWWCNNHLEKYESQWEGLSHVLWKIKCLKPPTSLFCFHIPWSDVSWP